MVFKWRISGITINTITIVKPELNSGFICFGIFGIIELVKKR